MNRKSNNAWFISTQRKHLSCLVVPVLLVLLNGCAQFSGPASKFSKEDQKTFFKPLREPKEQNEGEADTIIGQQADSSEIDTALGVIPPPKLSVSQAAKAAEKVVIPKLEDKQVAQQSYNNLPIPGFINEVYGNQLGLNFILQPSVKDAPDLVTLRLSAPISQDDFYVLATKTLASYGVTTFEREGVLVFDYSAQAAGDETPIIMSGRALPEVPAGNRPIFQIYPLKALKTPDVRSVLSQIFGRNDLDVKEDINRNALLIQGKYEKVQQAVAAINLLDRPSMAGMNSVILQPVISTAKELSDNLLAILKTEGFEVKAGESTAPVRLLPLESTGQVVIFAKEQETLDYIVEWARKLETKRESEVKNGLFSYQVQSTKASHIVNLLSQLGVANGLQPMQGSGENGRVSQVQARPQTTNDNENSQTKGRYAVDEMLNTILFSGSGKDWTQALAMIKRMDRPAPSVMIEVILAEVSLDESDNSAIEWLFKSSIGAYDVVGSTFGNGLNFTVTDGMGDGAANNTRAALNFLYSNNRTTIRSRPRVMVKSGESANINVGDRIPVLSTQSQGTSTADAPIVKNYVYQETGVILDITPTVHATGMVDLEISQELSEAAVSGGDQPRISNRSIQTVLTLRDGGSALIGGLIRSKDSGNEVGVPLLGKVPVLGRLFRGDGSTQERTELMIMIIPYILNSPDEVEGLTDDLQRARLEALME
ncbi:type II and III secretion system protein [Alteromonas gilva]|uniref:Type II and III secretion system protein n=1 Tax=Alteromonas gilva TaxID=2987522 RepID=A0ABT5L7F7_9ALTE|nr:type II and III secretion system protein [Alteromonas gilva]MDC8833000.1 type II and III secretion system protein [Alteromonas gilva]